MPGRLVLNPPSPPFSKGGNNADPFSRGGNNVDPFPKGEYNAENLFRTSLRFFPSFSQRRILSPSSLQSLKTSSNDRHSPTQGTFALLDCWTALTAIYCHRWDFFCFTSLSSNEMDFFDLKGRMAETPNSVTFCMISSIRSFSGRAWRRMISTEDSVADEKPSKIRMEASS